jgi:hypothetical protein
MSGLFGSKTISKSSVSPLEAMYVQKSTYGVGVGIVFGTTRIAGNIIDYVDFTAIPHTSSQQTGKGGSTTYTDTTYTYTVWIFIGICEGQISGVGKIWQSNNKYTGGLASVGLTLYNGALGQAPATYLSTYHPDHAIGYNSVAYVGGGISLDTNGNTPNYSFEVYGLDIVGGGNLDANPAVYLPHLLSTPQYGVNFLSTYIGDMTTYNSYIVSNDLFLSEALDQQQKCSDIITNALESTNSNCYWSQGLLKFVPYLDSLSPIYILTDDDLINEGEDTIITSRMPQADAYNVHSIEFLNRSNDYNIEIASVSDLSNIALYGTRKADVKQKHHLMTATRAKFIAQLIMQRNLYVRNQYVFKLGWEYILLEPMDIIAITSDVYGYNELLIRVLSIKENEGDGTLEFTCEEYPTGNATAPLYPVPYTSRASRNYNDDPGNINAPVIFEPPDALGSGLYVWMGASGGVNWGGADVWISENNNTYKNIGRITNPSRQGILSTSLPYHIDPDTTDTLSVDMTMSRTQLLSGTQADADNYNTICYVDEELISYETATLTGTNLYDLTYLRRGVYGTTIKQHNQTSQFMRIDQNALFSYPFTIADTNKTLYIKFTSINIYGGGEQSLADVSPFMYTIKGSALFSPLPNISNLRMSYLNNNAILQWDIISDFRTPITYEIRRGTSWALGQVVATTSVPNYVVANNDTYWISASYQVISNGSIVFTAYSQTPTEIIVTGARVVQNVVATFDEQATGWTGTRTVGLLIMGSDLELMPILDFDSSTDVDLIVDVDWYGGPLSSGTYTIPTGHIIDIGDSALCNVSCNYTFHGENTTFLDGVVDIDSMPDWDGSPNLYSNAIVQINVGDQSNVYAGWANFTTGQYLGRYFNFRMILTTSSSNVTTVLSGFTFTVDMPDRIDSGNISISAGGQTVNYTTPFHNVPTPTITIFNATAGDDVLLTNQTSTGFTVQIKNSGSGVARSINWVSHGY